VLFPDEKPRVDGALINRVKLWQRESDSRCALTAYNTNDADPWSSDPELDASDIDSAHPEVDVLSDDALLFSSPNISPGRGGAVTGFAFSQHLSDGLSVSPVVPSQSPLANDEGSPKRSDGANSDPLSGPLAATRSPLPRRRGTDFSGEGGTPTSCRGGGSAVSSTAQSVEQQAPVEPNPEEVAAAVAKYRDALRLLAVRKASRDRVLNELIAVAKAPPAY
jgi:hypothetical protein